MNKYAYLPLDGLFAIDIEKITSANIGDIFSYAEKEIKSLPEGRITSLVLLFYFIKYLKNTDLPFLVKGGIPLQYYLKDKARPTYDLDILTYLKGKDFYQKLNESLNNQKDDLKFKILKYNEKASDEYYPYDTFDMEIEASLNGKILKQFVLDGVVNSIYNDIHYHEYLGPRYILDNFKGVEIEYLMADKILAITGRTARPIKHLIDIYSLININIDKNKLKKYLELILKIENKDIKSYQYIIKDDKKFFGNYIFNALSVGYNITLDEMRSKINDWMRTNL